MGELCPVLHPSPLNSQQLLNSASSSQRGPCPGSGPRHCPTACSRAFTQTPRRAERGHKFKGGTQGSPQPKAHEKTGGHRAEGQPVARGVFTTPKRKRDTKARGTQCREESLRSQKETGLKDLGLGACRDGSAFQKQNILASLLSLSPPFFLFPPAALSDPASLTLSGFLPAPARAPPGRDTPSWPLPQLPQDLRPQ